MPKKQQQDLLLGAHMSIAGGVHKAIDRGAELGCTAIQIFTKNNNRWQSPPISEEDAALFKEKLKSGPVKVAFAHNAYLINLASGDMALWEKSIAAMLDEMERAEKLGIPFLVMHPGSHGGDGEKKGIERIVRALKKLIKATKGYKLKLALETTAGQGASIGHRFEHLAEIIDKTESPERMGVCFDTCHVFAAGYDISTPKGYEKVLKEFDDKIGLKYLLGIHLNDSLHPAGSKKDRHEHIGKGHIGIQAFKMILHDPRLSKLPMSLETPKAREGMDDAYNLKVLWKLAGVKKA